MEDVRLHRRRERGKADQTGSVRIPSEPMALALSPRSHSSIQFGLPVPSLEIPGTLFVHDGRVDRIWLYCESRQSLQDSQVRGERRVVRCERCTIYIGRERGELPVMRNGHRVHQCRCGDMRVNDDRIYLLTTPTARMAISRSSPPPATGLLARPSALSRMLTTLVANSPTSRLHSDNSDLKMAREIMNEL
jgi:hypothetical protein